MIVRRFRAPMQEESMLRNRLTNIWGRLKGRMTPRSRGRMDDYAGNVVRFDKISVLASEEGQGDALYLADAHDEAMKRAAFSQHISS